MVIHKNVDEKQSLGCPKIQRFLLNYLNITESMYRIYRLHKLNESVDRLPRAKGNTVFTAGHFVKGKTLECVIIFRKEHWEGQSTCSSSCWHGQEGKADPVRLSLTLLLVFILSANLCLLIHVLRPFIDIVNIEVVVSISTIFVIVSYHLYFF